MVTFIVSMFLLIGVLTAVLVRRQARSTTDPHGPRDRTDPPSNHAGGSSGDMGDWGP
jgi:hypothetical protein